MESMSSSEHITDPPPSTLIENQGLLIEAGFTGIFCISIQS